MQVEDLPAAAPSGDGGRDIFLSYASRDAAAAQRICEHLEAAGVSVWMAPRDVPAGALYADAIVRAINACRSLVLVLSHDSVDSSHVGKEIERASSKRKPVVAVRLDDSELTPSLEYFLSESQWIDARAGVEPALTKLTEGVRRLTAGGPLTPAHSSPRAAVQATPAVPVRSGGRTVGIVVGVALALLLGWLIADKAGVFRKSPACSSATVRARRSAGLWSTREIDCGSAVYGPVGEEGPGVLLRRPVG